VLPQPREPLGHLGPHAARDLGFDADERRRNLLRNLRHAAALAIEGAVLIGLVLLFFLRVPEVAGHSMAPQIDDGDHVLINTLAYSLRIDLPGCALGPILNLRLRPIGRGDVVAFVHGSGDDRRIYLKRVIALPGETVSVERGIVSIDGRPLAESSGILSDATDMTQRTVPPDSYFVLGDNRGDSDDSRSFGPVPASAVVGRAAFVFWPPDRARPIR